MMGVFAEFDCAMTRERGFAGLDNARARGKRLGRPKVPPSVEHSICAAQEAGKRKLSIARDLRVGFSTVHRVLGIASGTRVTALEWLTVSVWKHRFKIGLFFPKRCAIAG